MKKILLSIIYLFSIGLVIAQESNFTGIVLDADTQLPLTGASVIEKGTSNGVTTDIDGQFELKTLNSDAVLIFSFIGYQPLEMRGSLAMVIPLSPDISILDEIVVTALNLERSTKGLGYAVQKLNSKDIAEVKSPNFVDNLAGRVAGVTVNQGATGVGSSSKITIRGEASFTNNNPLFVVDGIPINNTTNFNFSNAAAAGFQEVDFGNGGMELSQDDIEAVTILKGPNSAALYGTRAANGVVLITTKDGSGNQGLGISVNTSTFIDRPFQLPDFQNKYGQGNSEQFEFVDGLGGGINDNITYSWGPKLDAGLNIPQFDSPVQLANGTIVRGGDVSVHGGATITPTPFNSHPDNLKNFYETGVTSVNNIAISSASTSGNFRLSLTDLRSKSFIPGVNLNRKTAVGNFTFRPTEKLKISSSIQYINSQSDNRPANGYGSENINYSLVAWGPRSLNIESLKDYWQPGLENIQQFSFNYTFFDNPYFILLENRNSFNRDRVFGHIGASYDLTSDLSFHITSGMDYSNELRKYRRNFSTNRFKTGAYAEQNVFFREVNTNFLLRYQKQLWGISADFSLGGNRMDQSAATKQTEALSLAQPGIFNFSNAASPLNVYQFESNKRINSFYGIAKFSYDNFLFLDITARNDWSSALASPSSTDHVSFFYPSTSLAYILSNTIDLPAFFSFAKLRASWAQVGNDTAPYQTSSAFVAGTSYHSQPTFTNQDIIANADLNPEKTTAIEVGTDLRFFDDKLMFDLTYYDALTEHQIISFPVPISSGYQERVVNGGAVRSKGIEILAGVTVFQNPHFNWDTYLNFSHSSATVESLPKGAEKITLAYSRVYDNVNQTVWFQVEEGGHIGDMYGTGYLKNENGQFIIDDEGKFIADNTLRKLGNYNPDFILGWSNEISYKNWNLSFLLDWHQGGELVSRTLSLAGVSGQLKETENRPEAGIIADGVVNIGTPEDPVWQPNTTAVSAEGYFRQFHDRNHEENNVYDASYLKLRQLSIGYKLHLNKDKKGRILNISLIGRNLYAWSKIPHFDPEQLAVQGNKFISGVEDMSYPSSRSFGLKLGLNF